MHIVEADIAYGSAYLTVNNDEVYRVWIGERGTPLMERLTPFQMTEWKGHKAQTKASWKCKAQPTADPPQDCDWPFCGCDPVADKVLDKISESGLSIVRHASAPSAGEEK